MLSFCIVNENTEDTLGTADSLEDAVLFAKEVAKQAEPGDLISILESGGMAVKQFVLTSDGIVKEQAVAGQVRH
ncbi:MAG TPA: hypothetical protein VKS79_01805 [Gemmataceae bacterium]|nr:hypothetical protein [Gemmataceae bacterium]